VLPLIVLSEHNCPAAMTISEFTVLATIYFLNSFCLENTSTIASGERFVMMTLPFQLAGMFIGGIVVDMDRKEGLLRILFATFICIASSVAAAVTKISIAFALGMCMCNFCTSMLTIYLLAMICFQEECTHVSFQLGVLAGLKTLGVYGAVASYPLLEERLGGRIGILACDAALLLLAIVLHIVYMTSCLDVGSTSGSVSEQEQLLSEDSESIDIEMSYETDIDSIKSSQLKFSMDDIKKDLFPYQVNPALYISSLCGMLLTGSLVPTSYVFFDPVSWKALLNPLVYDVEAYSQSIRYLNSYIYL
jgi:hypothetical protein